MSSFVAPVLEDEDDEAAVEQTLRPRSLDEFVGQERVKEQLEIALVAAKARGEALDHVLLAGPPGLGKTSLAHIVREELGVGLRTIAGPAVEKKDIAAILTALEPRDVLFVDEIHRMSRTAEEILYPALEDFRIDIVMGEGAGARTLTLDLPPFTLVGATTRTGLLTTPLRDRFGLTFRLDYYDAGRARRDRAPLRAHPRRRDRSRRGGGDRAPRARHAAHREPHPAPRARRRRGAAPGLDHERRSRARRSTLLEIDEQGLDREARELLRTIAGKFDGGPVGLSTLAASLGEEQETIEDVYEPYLLQLGFIQRTPRGRTITKLGRAHIGAAPAEEPSSSERHLDADPRRPARGLRRAASTGRSRAFAEEHGVQTPAVEIELADSARFTLAADRARAGLRDGDAARARDDDDAPDALIVPLGSIRRIELRKTPEDARRLRLLSVRPLLDDASERRPRVHRDEAEPRRSRRRTRRRRRRGGCRSRSSASCANVENVV